jgi:acetyl-CoA hydrolase
MIDLASVIRPGEGVLCGQNCAQPQTLVEALVAQRASFPGARLFPGTDPVPCSQLGDLIRAGHIKADVVLLQVSPPNSRGEYSLGLGVEYLPAALQVARAVIAEVNDQVPWTHTEPLLRREDFALTVDSSRAPVMVPSLPPGEADLEIARLAAQLVPDGAVLQCGTGTLCDAVLAALGARRRLGCHSGVIGDGMAELARRGAIDGPVVAGALVGTKLLFDWARDNPALRLRSSDYTHAAAVLAKFERFVAINSAAEVDFTGQVDGAVALDFVRAAHQSREGVSIIVLPASRIVETLSGRVSVPRSEAGVIVTERGAADLRGCTLRERERRLRAISGNS